MMPSIANMLFLIHFNKVVYMYLNLILQFYTTQWKGKFRGDFKILKGELKIVIELRGDFQLKNHDWVKRDFEPR